MCILLDLTARIYGFRIIIRLLMAMNLLDGASLGILQTSYGIMGHSIGYKVVNQWIQFIGYSELLKELLCLFGWIKSQIYQYIIIQIKQKMLSPIKIQEYQLRQSIYVPSNKQTLQTYNYSNKLSSTYQYPTKQYFLNTLNFSSNSNKNYQSQSQFQFDVFNISRAKVRSYNTKINQIQNNQKRFQSKPKEDIFVFIPQMEMKKPQPFMGAFLQTQAQFNFFNLNIKIPSLKEFQPFSRVLSQSILNQKNIVSQLKLKQSKNFYNRQNMKQKSKQKNQKQTEQVKQQQNEKLLSLSLYENLFQENYINNDTVIYKLDQNLNESCIPYKKQFQQSLDISNFLQNYDEQIEEQKHKSFIKSAMWQQNFTQSFNHAYEFHISKCSQFIEKVQSRIQLAQKHNKFTDADICSCLIKMILGLQSDLFLLDYHILQWKYNKCPAKFQCILKTSFQAQLENVLIIASFKSKLETALKYIKRQPYRRILQQVAVQIKQFLSIIQQIALQIAERNGSFLDFVLNISQIKSQIMLVYQLLINQSWIKHEGKSYMDFNISFLNSEAVIFQQIVRLSSANDTLIGKGYQFGLKLLSAAFKPITFTLNRIVFQQTTEISNRDETYLRFYFENLKDLLSYLGKRIDLIKQQSNQLYMICRYKQQIKIVMETDQLQEYTTQWNHIFANKKKSIEEVHNRYKKKLKQEKQKKEEQKIKQIYQLKAKLLKSIQQTKQRKSQVYLEGIKQIEKLKKDITERQERRRLTYLIQKQQQKGFLLAAQLKQKRKLIQLKQQLLDQATKDGIIIMEKVIKSQLIKEDKLTKQNIDNQSSLKQIVEKQQNKIVQQIKQLNKNQIKSSIKTDNKIQLQKIEYEKISSQINMSKMVSNISNPSVSIQPQSQQQSQQKSINLQSDHNPASSGIIAGSQVSENIHVSTNTVLQICIDNIIRQQIQVTNMALSHLVYDKYQLFSIMQFMRKIFLNGDGSVNSNFLHLSVSTDSKINTQYFNQCSLFDNVDEFIRQLAPQFYQVHSVIKQNQGLKKGVGIYQNRQINMLQQGIQIFVGFQFTKLPVLLQPYFSYIHLSKYMQIFSHILKIKHCSNLISNCLLTLNEHKTQLQSERYNRKFLKKLFLTRHIIHIYLNTLQSFLYHRIIQKQLKTVRTKLKNKDINQLSIVHLNMLDSIIRKGLIQNSLNQISKKIKGLLMDIRKFKNIVDSFCANDIHNYLRDQIEAQVNNMHRIFQNQQHFLESLFYHP